MIGFLLLFYLFSREIYAIRRDIVYEVCRRDPSLPFCDAHFLGKPPGDKSKTPPPSDQNLREIRDWLEGFKDDSDDEDGVIEKSRRLHVDKNQYCNKYHQNYKNYCSSGKDGELEGVLNQFCAAFRIACEGIIPDLSTDDGGFPKPEPLEEKFHVDQKNPRRPGERFQRESSKTEEYCKQFNSEYESLCSSPSKHAAEFCQSFKDNCIKKDSSSSTPSTSSSSSSSPSSSSEEGFFEENIPDSSETEGAGAEVGSKVTEYCEKYSENYNYYCVGDTTGDNGKFCSSYRKNCPEKVSS